jgi:hypothetical protein
VIALLRDPSAFDLDWASRASVPLGSRERAACGNRSIATSHSGIFSNSVAFNRPCCASEARQCIAVATPAGHTAMVAAVQPPADVYMYCNLTSAGDSRARPAAKRNAHRYSPAARCVPLALPDSPNRVLSIMRSCSGQRERASCVILLTPRTPAHLTRGHLSYRRRH